MQPGPGPMLWETIPASDLPVLFLLGLIAVVAMALTRR